MKEYPKISIITPTYNRCEYIEETIISVINQNYPNLEYIIVDGGSTDGTLEIIKKYESKLAYWISEPDNGMYHALQKGFDKATGEIMAWLNSDDVYHHNSLFIVADIFSALQHVEWITGTPSLNNTEGQCVKVFPTQKWSKHRIAAGDYRWIQQESTFWRKSLWERAGGNLDVKYKFAADFALWTRFFEYATLYSVETTLSGFRMHGDQLSLSYNLEYENEVKEILNKNCEYKSTKQTFILNLFRIQQYCYRSNLVFRVLAILITLLLKRTYRLPKIIHYDFELNKWKL